MVSDRLLFVHVPKTGGSSVRVMLPAAGIKVWESGPYHVEDHYGLPELRAAHPGIEKGRLSFGFVRHPVAWLASRWAWAMVSGFPGKIAKEPAAAAHWMASCWSDDYQQFVENYLTRFPGIYTQTVCRALGIWTQKPVDFIGDTERLIEDLLIVLQCVGERFDERALRACPHQRVAASGEFAARTKIRKALEQRIVDAEPLLNFIKRGRA